MRANPTILQSQIGSFSLYKTICYEYISLDNVPVGTLFASINKFTSLVRAIRGMKCKFFIDGSVVSQGLFVYTRVNKHKQQESASASPDDVLTKP